MAIVPLEFLKINIILGETIVSPIRWPMPEISYTFKLRDGRNLGYAEYGKPDGIPVFYFHGYPGSRLEAGLADKAALHGNFRFIGIDRPGYGLSDPKPGRTLMDWPDDVAELADHLNFGKFHVVGLSGGAPYASACAWKIPSRLISAGIISGLGPVDVPGLKSRLSVFQRFWFSAARNFPFIIKPSARIVGKMVCRHPDKFRSILKERTSEPDNRALDNPGILGAFTSSFHEGLNRSTEGFHRDLLVYASPWGFKLEDIRCKVRIWHGEKDFIVHADFGRHYAKCIPGCQAEFFPDEGHFSLAGTKIEHMLEGLAKT
ncbi:MAG TPA: alpha/beta hydrolase [Lentisphaeria bacterium]|nr:alpha/beta hydrolase [Lentisphaeria bacterium]